MQIQRQSILSGKHHTMNIPGLTLEMLIAWQQGALIQDAMPDLTHYIPEASGTPRPGHV